MNLAWRLTHGHCARMPQPVWSFRQIGTPSSGAFRRLPGPRTSHLQFLWGGPTPAGNATGMGTTTEGRAEEENTADIEACPWSSSDLVNYNGGL